MTIDNKPYIAVLMTCHNRKDLTLASMRSVTHAVGSTARYRFYLVDDGSTDGTADAVIREFPDAQVIQGDGNLYWNRGMRLSWQAAQASGPDFFLWLNDDTLLRRSALTDLLSLYLQTENPKTIVVGCTADPQTGEITYGGYRRARKLSRLSLRRLRVDETECDTMNGNCVLFPARVVADIGINSRHYTHAFGDNDYGHRARKAGYRIVELKEPVALQSRNRKYEEASSRLTFQNWRFILRHPKGVPVAEWWAFCREHGGLLWPINFLMRYLKILQLRRS
ncbi:hypothetical protein XI03_33015 [Bradyrhizobium sp. CCBAU 65884]|uniref:glycosyltransferase family 2 protein n=1 Tax=Bradyrhizobium sp. CCBAU 65884 TaxID=722477 RepID=UPI002306B5EF|nr:glycosyltransferase family 2 protein [Bradyrhizobium sp. CCBAU 65884]MDA9479226.1 hypothetical protein [Bradyrhizobium sp. CCBAU 65884]